MNWNAKYEFRFNISFFNIIIVRIMNGCVGKKTALLQILVVGWLARFANVLFCAVGFLFSLRGGRKTK
jgi:hypothetical protein